MSFGKSFVQPVDHLPQALRHLRFGYKFNHSVDHLPNLETLTLGNAFTRSIDLLPQTLTKLIVEGPGAFNQKIPSLPNLTNLSIFSQFNQPLDHLPSSVTSLVLLAISKVPASKTLTHLCCYGDLISSIPDSLTSLNCTRPSPATMEIISKSSISSLEYTLQNVGLIHCLPESLTTLVLTRFTRFSMTTKIAYLPASLTRLEFHGNLKVYSANNLPPSLTHLILFSCKQPIDCFPPNLTHLSFASTFNHSITGKLPQTLKSLELGTGFSQPLRSLPLSLKVLTGNVFSLIYYSLFIIHYLLFIIYYLLFIIYYLLFIIIILLIPFPSLFPFLSSYLFISLILLKLPDTLGPRCYMDTPTLIFLKHWQC